MPNQMKPVSLYDSFQQSTVTSRLDGFKQRLQFKIWVLKRYDCRQTDHDTIIDVYHSIG